MGLESTSRYTRVHHRRHGASFLRNPRDRQRGITLIWTAIFLFLFVGFVGLACDWAYVLLVAHQLQNAADAASLAGAQFVRTDQTRARELAHDIAYANLAARLPVQLDLNGANAAEGDIVIGRFDRDTQTFTPDTGSPNAVKAHARRTTGSLGGPLPLIFAPVFGVATTEVSRSAIAMVGGGTGAGLIVLDYYAPRAFDVSGTFTLDVSGGAIQVNSDQSDAMWAHGGPTIDAPEINIYGEDRIDGTVHYDPDSVHTGRPRIDDPLAGIPEPTWDPATGITLPRIRNGNTVTIDPGFYSSGITMTGGNLTLNPGIYILDGAGLSVTGGTFVAEGVMLFITGTGSVDLRGNGDLTITPPDPDLYHYPDVAIYEGISIFQDRENYNDAGINGTNLWDLQGTIYFPSNHLVANGDGMAFGNQLIVDTMRLTGRNVVTINYDGRFPAPGNRVFLVQ